VGGGGGGGVGSTKQKEKIQFMLRSTEACRKNEQTFVKLPERRLKSRQAWKEGRHPAEKEKRRPCSKMSAEKRRCLDSSATISADLAKKKSHQGQKGNREKWENGPGKEKKRSSPARRHRPSAGTALANTGWAPASNFQKNYIVAKKREEWRKRTLKGLECSTNCNDLRAARLLEKIRDESKKRTKEESGSMGASGLRPISEREYGRAQTGLNIQGKQ